MVPETCHELISLRTMASANNIVSPPLLHGVCPLQAAEPCLIIVTGKHCLILPCQDFGNGFHFSHSRHCHLDCCSASRALAERHLQPNTSVIISAMPRLRHCMHSRRRGLRGGFNRSRVSTSSSSESPDSTTELPSYPNTRSGRGQWDNVVHTVELTPISLSGPHNTHFRFNSSLNRPTIIATIAISFKEVSAAQDTLPGRENKVELGSHGLSNMQQGESSQAPHGSGKSGDTGKRQMDVVGSVEAPNVHGRGASEEEDDWYWFACRIEEEPAPENPPAQHVASR